MDNIQVESCSNEEIKSEEIKSEDSLNENTNESLPDIDIIKGIDLQYFHVQDAPNEIIVTTDGEIEETLDAEECMENVEENIQHAEESIERIDEDTREAELSAEYSEEKEAELSTEYSEEKEAELSMEYSEENILCVEESVENDDGDESERNGQVFILPTLADIKELIKCYCEQTSCRFVGQIKTRDFGLSSSECDLSGHRILWQDIPHKNKADDIITFDGIPHMCVGHYQFGCEFGADLKAARKEKLQKMKENGEKNVKTRNVKTPSKKCGCPAKIVVRQIIKFPEFEILKNTEGRKRTGTTKLKESLKNNRGNVKTEVLYVGRLPDISEHKFHELMEGRKFSKEMVHPELVVKAQELFLLNKSNLEIYEQIRNHVLNEMFCNQDPPDPKRRRYFPKLIDIRNIVGRIRRLSRFSEEEVEMIRTYIEEIRRKYEDASILFDVSETSSHEIIGNCINVENPQLSESIQSNKIKKERDIKLQQTFVFCYQTHSQQWLMKRYSHLCYLVEIETGSDMKCALPYKMYCLVVQTNVDFQSVGVVIVSKQRKYGLVECLKCFREWNITWDPDYFFIDYSEDIEEAIATVFPKTTYFLNPQSCRKKWMQFLNTPSNDLQEHSVELSICLESMQYALTEESLTIFASLLESNEVWKKNDNLRTWFQNSWLHSANKWVFGYRPDDLIVMQHMKISLDDCLQVYNDALGKSAKTNGFYELIQEIFNVISLQEYEKYIKRNNELHLFHKQLENKYSFPEYMQGLQVSLYPYVEVILKIAKENDFIITHDQLGLFTVELQQETKDEDDGIKQDDHVEDENCDSSTNLIIDEAEEKKDVISTKFSYVEYSSKLDKGEFTVSFGDSRTYPFCTCTHWKFYKLPCVHICAVCCKLRGWRYQMFSPLYRSNSIFDLDYTCLSNEFTKTDSDTDPPNQDNTTLDVIPGNIFESFLKVGANNVVLDQANEFLQRISKMTYLFKDRNLYTKIHQQLTGFVGRLKTYLLTKGNNGKLQIPLSTLQSRSDYVALSIVNNLKINKSTITDNAGGGTRSENVVGVICTNKSHLDTLPRLQPISNDDHSKYVFCTLKNTSTNLVDKGLDLINFNIEHNTVEKNVVTSPSSLGANSNLTDARDGTDQVHTGVQSILLGKRVGSNINSPTSNKVKIVQAYKTDMLTSSAREKIAVTSTSSKDETIIEGRPVKISM